jgi:ferredoxin
MNRRTFINGIFSLIIILFTPSFLMKKSKVSSKRESYSPLSVKITFECINCGACEPECPNSAIYEGGRKWLLAGKEYGENDVAPSGAKGFFSNDYFYIVPDKCTECIGSHDEPQCVAVCPVDCIIMDINCNETKETLTKKKNYLDSIGRKK